MNSQQKYPLEQLILIRKNQFDQAVKILEEKKVLLVKATEKLNALSQERDVVLQHKLEKLNQLRATQDQVTTSDKIQLMKGYLKIVNEKLAEKEKKVKEQQKQVDLAQKQVEVATHEMYQAQKDLEKIEIGKVEWEKENAHMIRQKEANEQDEQGSITHTTRKREAERRSSEDN
jgi:hypothetical protein